MACYSRCVVVVGFDEGAARVICGVEAVPGSDGGDSEGRGGVPSSLRARRLTMCWRRWNMD